MIITLPKDLIQIHKTRKQAKDCFSFKESYNRVTIPQKVYDMFSGKNYGVDIWVSKKEKAIFLKFVPKEKAYFAFNNSNRYLGCADLFKWLHIQEIPTFDDYDYTDYQIDEKNKIVQVNLERK